MSSVPALWLRKMVPGSDSDFITRNTLIVPLVKILIFLDLAKTISFLGEHELRVFESGTRCKIAQNTGL